MLLNELMQQWDTIEFCAGERCVRRLAIKHQLEWFVGYDGTDKALMFSCQQEHPLLTDSVSIGTRKFKKKSGQWMQVIRLKEAEHEQVFLHMCADLLEYSQQGADEKEAYRLLSQRYKQWLKLLKHGASGALSEEEQRGLLGELNFLAQRLAQAPDKLVPVIDGWQGPEGEPKDFFYGDEWFEIKTLRQGVNSVHISSLEQLAPRGIGQLIVYTIAWGGADSPDAVTLNQMVNKVQQLVAQDSDAALLLEDKLLKVGYLRKEEYDKKAYIFTDASYYDVREDFPRLDKNDLPAAIVGVVYDLDIASLEAWKINAEEA